MLIRDRALVCMGGVNVNYLYFTLLCTTWFDCSISGIETTRPNSDAGWEIFISDKRFVNIENSSLKVIELKMKDVLFPVDNIFFQEIR